MFASHFETNEMFHDFIYICSNTISGTPNIHKKYQQVVDLHVNSNFFFVICTKIILLTQSIYTYFFFLSFQGSIKNLPPSCTSTMEPSLVHKFWKQNPFPFVTFILPSNYNISFPPWMMQCFFPQNVISFIETPLFIINSAYDAWQVKETNTSISKFYEIYW